ncbi:hypothetical protein AGMMS49975_20970 [Clostridia bacterium]|nr:hypothetical protein AGMMS49975_20970 [Clostridia bacterium]
MAFEQKDTQTRAARAKFGGEVSVKNGWYVLNLKGGSKEIGYDHGVILAEEIRDYIEETKRYVLVCMGIDYEYAKNDIISLIQDKISDEISDELEAIAAGVNMALALNSGKSYDKWDIAVINWMEGWSGYAYDPQKAYKHYSQSENANLTTHITAPIRERRDHCSAFAATGSYTKDGKPVMFHNSFNVFETSGYANVIMKITPKDGHTFTMQTQCGFVHSMADFYVVSVGDKPTDRVAITETTIGGFNKYNPDSIPEFDRIRRAVQHFTSINYAGDESSFVSILRKGESGDYANTWLIADYRDNSIWEIEEGLEFFNIDHKLADDRESYFIGANYPKDPRIKNLECSNDGGDDIRRHQGARRVRLPQLLEEYKAKGGIDLSAGEKIIADHYDVYNEEETNGNSRTVCSHYNLDKREYMSDPSRPKPYQPRGAIDGMGIDAELAVKLQLDARFGSSCGTAWYAAEFLKAHPQFSHLEPFLHDRPAQPWTVLPE